MFCGSSPCFLLFIYAYQINWSTVRYTICIQLLEMNLAAMCNFHDSKQHSPWLVPILAVDSEQSPSDQWNTSIRAASPNSVESDLGYTSRIYADVT